MMTGKQNAVLWSGILLIIFRLATTGQWSVLWNTAAVKQGGTTKGSANSSSSPAGTPSGGAVSV